jgi:hypothetical protein
MNLASCTRRCAAKVIIRHLLIYLQTIDLESRQIFGWATVTIEKKEKRLGTGGQQTTTLNSLQI